MPNTQPVSRVANVAVQITPQAAQSQALNSLLYLGSSAVIDTTERYRTYLTLAAVANDFGTSADEYRAAARWFAQSPQPKEFLAGRWVQSASKGGLRCGTLSAAQQAIAGWNAVGALGSLKIAKDGAAGVNVTAINLTAAANMNAVAAAITAGTGFPAGVTCVWNSVYSRFEFESSTAGAASAIAFLTATGTGTDISAMLLGQSTQGGYTYAGQAAETVAAALALFDDMIGQRFYGVGVGGLAPGANAGADTAALLAAAAYIEGASAKHLLFLTTQEAGSISGVSTTDIGYQLKQLAYKRTFVQYSSSAVHAAISAAARILTVDYEGSNTAITLKFKQEPGVVAENLTVTQALAVEAKNVNVFVAYENGTSIMEQGVQSSGDFTDVMTCSDWLATTTQRDIYNLMYASTTKIPQTDDGANLIQATIEARCAQAVNNGMAAPGVWNASGFGKLKQGDFMQKGYYVYIAPMRTQATADRAARRCPSIQVAVKLAGAIHSVDCTININQ